MRTQKKGETMSLRMDLATYYVKMKYPELKQMTTPARKVAMKILRTLYYIYNEPLAFVGVHSIDDVIREYEAFSHIDVIFDIQKEPIEMFYKQEVRK